MSNSMDDVAAQAQALFVIGSNTTEQHPVFGAKLRQAVIQRGAKLIVADPRRIDLTDFATLHLRQRPGTDIALLNGLMQIILVKGWEDKAFIAERCEGFDEFRATVEQYPPEKVSEITGIPVEKLYLAAEIMGTHKPMAVIWAMGITQHIVGVRNVMTLANLQMLLGNMGKPGGGVNPLRGQNNVQGACDMGGLPNVYPAYQPVTNEEVRKKFAAAWGLDEGLRTKDKGIPSVHGLSSSVGLTVTEMIPGILEGKIHGLYILAEDPIMSDPDTKHIRRCLEAADLIVLQEIFPTETAQYADILLPGVTFAEKTGTFTNTERRVQMVRQALEPLGEARQDWEIIAEVARRILNDGQRTTDDGQASVVHGPWSSWEYHSPADILKEINALTPSYAGISYERLEQGERLQWPVPSLDHPGTPTLHTKGFARGRGQFMPIDHLPPAEQPDDDYPFILSTGRVLYHWHGGEMTRRSQSLLTLYSQALIEVSPWDAEKLGLQAGQNVRVSSRRGALEAQAWITERVPPGMVYANFHFPAASANELTQAVLDPVSKIPEYKVSAVKLTVVK
jgi:predicted molibdopterin-dependent oxidoreductase YjgC